MKYDEITQEGGMGKPGVDRTAGSLPIRKAGG